MVRNLAFLVFGLLLICNGCHKATGPAENNNTLLDSGFAELGSHYPSMYVNYINVVMTGYHRYKYDTDDRTYYDTSLRSSNLDRSLDGGLVPPVDDFIDSSSKIIRDKRIIPFLEGGTDKRQYLGSGETTESSFRGVFTNLSFSYEPDSSIYILLTGVEAAKNINTLNFYYEDHTLPTSSFNNQDIINAEDHGFYRCTDSTRIEITLGYHK